MGARTAVLLALLLAALAACGSEPPARPERLAEAAAAVARRAPASWPGWAPLSAAELADAPPFPPPDRLTAIAPRGPVEDGRPRLRWGGVPLAERVALRVLDAEGTERWRRSAQARSMEYPPEEPALAPGGYLLEVRAGAPATPSATAAFEVADAAAVRRLEALRTAVAEHAPADLAALLEAHGCARLGFLLAAEAAAQRALSVRSRDAEALALLRWVHARIGQSEGW